MSRPTFFLSIVACVFVAGCTGGGDPTTPNGAVQAMIDGARDNDVQALAATAVPPDAFAQMRAAWDEQRQEPMSDSEKAEFMQTMTMLTSENAEETLFTMAKPQLAQMQAGIDQVAGMVTMGAAQAIPQDALSGEEQESLDTVLGAVSEWIQGLDLTDEDQVKQAIGVVCATARELDVPDPDTLRGLEFEQLLGKAGVVLGGVKEVLQIYGIDYDQTLDSIALGEATIEGDTATVPMTMTVLGAEVDWSADLQRIDGRWYVQPPEDVPAEDAGLARPTGAP